MPYAPEGTLDRKYCVIAEAPARQEMVLGRPLVGPSGQLFDSLCGQVGLPRRHMYLTNVVQKPIIDIKLYLNYRGELTALGHEEVAGLHEELWDCKANVYILMGNLALAALTGKKGITKQRGSILPGIIRRDGKERVVKCIPTIHPAATFKGQYLWRYYIRSDLKKIKVQGEFPEIRDLGYKFILDPSFQECVSYLVMIKDRIKEVSVDIEVANQEVSRISFAIAPKEGISIPIDCWSLEQEVHLWFLTSQIMGDPTITKIGQNFLFDMTFLLRKNNIITRGPIKDTMLAHHIMYPDFEKGLATLCSLHTDQPYYKDMVKHGVIDKADG